MNLIQTLVAFIFALGPLIILHELGHYSVARLCGVKVLRFSLGMGKVVWSRRFGPDQTEWALSALPFGGYVKMLDSREQGLSQLSPHDAKREFTRQNVWRRIAIVAAGPVANFIVAIVLFAALYMHGIEEPSSKLRAVAENTPAYAAGVRGGDVVSAVNGKPTLGWSELRWQVMQAAIDKRSVNFEVQRGAPGAAPASLALTMPAAALEGIDLEGDLLGKLGLGMARPKPLLGKILAGGAAERAGLRSGDLIASVDGQPVADGIAFIEAVRAAPARAIQVAGSRAGQPFALAVTPDAAREGAVTVGKISAEVALAPDMISVPAGPVEALGKGATKVWDTSAMTLKMMGRMITGQASWKNVTGPISIADYAGQTARAGLVAYLSFIAFISVSLGVMNLLPIPVLDGGVLLYYSLEVLTGRPVPERFDAVVQRLGVGLLITLMAVAMFNDVARLLG